MDLEVTTSRPQSLPTLRRQHTISLLLAVLAFLPALLPLYIIWRDGVNMPYWDQLDPDMANLFIKAHDGTLGLRDLAAQHNEHRLLVPRLIYLVLDPITRWNTRVEMVGAWLIMLLTSAGLVFLGRKTIWRDKTDWLSEMFWPVFLINILFFTPAQQENLTLGIGLANVLPFAWIVAGLVTASSNMRWALKLGLCIAFCAAATWSSGNGMLSWLLVAMPLFWVPKWREFKLKLWSVGIWAGSAIVIVAPYFVGYRTPDHGGVHPQSLSITKIVPYILAFLGNPFFWATQYNAIAFAIITGLLVLILLCLALVYLGWRCYHRSHDAAGTAMFQSAIPWLSIAGFAACNSVMAATSRAGFGTDQALSSRYVIFAIQLPIALVPLAALIFADLRRRSVSERTILWQAKAAGAMVGALLLVQLFVIPLSMASSDQARLRRRQGKAVLLLSPVLPENPLLKLLVHPTPVAVMDEIRKLNELGMINPPLITQQNALKIAVDPATAKDSIEGGMQNVWQPDKDSIGVAGYAYLIHQRRPVDLVLFTYENPDREQVIFATMDRIVGRPDLAAAKNDASYMGSGWDARLLLASIPSYLAQTKLCAWGLDADTGQIYRMDGELPIKR